MVVLPEVVHLVARHLTDAFPALLDIIEFVEGGTYLLLLGVYQLAQFLDKGLLGLKVLLFLFLQVVQIFLSQFAVAVLQAVELFADFVAEGFLYGLFGFLVVFCLGLSFGRLRFRCGFGCFGFALAFQGVEAGAEKSHAVLDFLHVLLQQFLEGCHEFFTREVAVVDLGFLLLLFGGFGRFLLS